MTDEPLCRCLDTRLADDVVEIEDATGKVRRFEGEALLLACASHYSGVKPLPVGEAGATSLLSGEPGWRVRVEDVEITLTLSEFVHLALHALPPSQVQRLRTHCDTLTLIGPAVYDADGKALQPKVRVPTQDRPAAR